MTMPRNSAALAIVMALIFLMAASPGQNHSDKPVTNQTICGLVRDIACPLQNKQSTARRFNRECAFGCARQGSPLAILADDGTMYLPISESMPDSNQRSRLMPFVGKYVRVVGEVYERKGMHAIVIKKIDEDRNVQLQGDAFQPE
jgi:hypothetical protein